MRVGRRLVLGMVAVAVGVGVPAACIGQDLEQAAAAFAAQWSAGDLSRLQNRFSQNGVRIQWEARPLGALSPAARGSLHPGVPGKP